MTNPSTKKITRRDALKLLGAATGAVALANLPSKWTKPELASGVLPAHAQTSQPPVPDYFIACSATPLSGSTGIVESIQAVVTSDQPVSVENIEVRVTIILINPAGSSIVHATGFTDATGFVSFNDLFCPFNAVQDYNLEFSFVDQTTYGGATCTLGMYTFNGC